eukprot:CAMPEP_0182419550 /NCGR_PEP_ID=MMETSP1167-20130531/3983_1 /TAXON_ID=2988 /ORGANISM="Mallomonas Sp, Strain CCMP3275" /LENGTH=297 /DNA_ID=CAMNT_0024594531 /DNA_START=202 /DNA_END=1091 /DNA_ORIENTATION=-
MAEELLLLEGIDKFGAGNWKTVSEYVGSKTTRQCDEHYWEVYLGIYGHSLPPKTFFPDSLSLSPSLSHTQTDTARVLSLSPSILPLDYLPIPVNHTLGESVVRDRGKDTGRGKERNELRERLSLLPGADLPGYMPLREDFDVEHDNDAESILADMTMGGEDSLEGVEDHPSERALKLQVVKIYNLKLDERERRKRFVIDQGLVDFRKQQQIERKRGREERELVARMKPFMRFQSPTEHEALVQGVIRAGKLRKQLDLLRSYRSLGLRTVESAKQHETERKRRETEAKARKQREREGG